MIPVAWAKFHLPVFILIVGFISCENHKETSPEHRYYYYPKANTYCDAKSFEYIYSLDSGRNWLKMKTSAERNTPPALGEQILIKETDDDIWFENEMHRNMYGGKLYNVITRDTVLLSHKPKEVKKTTAKQDSVTSSSKKKRNIFQKIFGKKKN